MTGKIRNNKQASAAGQVTYETAFEKNGLVVASKLQVPAKPKKIKLIAGLILVVLLAVGSYLILGTNKQQKTYALKVGDRTISQAELNKYLIYPENILKKSPKDAKKGLIDLMVKEQAAKTAGIQPSADDLAQAKARLAIQDESADEWLRLSMVSAAIDSYLQRQQDGQKQGYLYVFYFGNYLIPRPFEAAIPGFGDQARINKDKTYAAAQADKYYNLLKNKKITEADVLSQIKADNTLAVGGIKGSNFSTRFGDQNDVLWTNQLSNAGIKQAIQNQTSTGISAAVAVAKQAIKERPAGDQDYKDAMYFFFVLDKSGSASQQQLEQAIKNVKVVQ